MSLTIYRILKNTAEIFLIWEQRKATAREVAEAHRKDSQNCLSDHFAQRRIHEGGPIQPNHIQISRRRILLELSATPAAVL
jgi:hypothetical protein